MLNYRALSTLGQTSTRNALINFLKKYRKLALLLCLTTRAIKFYNGNADDIDVKAQFIGFYINAIGIRKLFFNNKKKAVLMRQPLNI